MLVLAEMYLPQQDEDLENTRSSLYRTSKNKIGDFVDVLLNQAFKQTGNQGLDGLGILKGEGEIQSESKFLGIGIGSKWHPEGTLRVWDGNIGTTIPYERELVGYEYYHCDGNEPPPSNEFISVEDARGDCRRAIYANVAQPEINGSYVPLEGTQVLLRDTFTIGNEITDENGYFSFDELRGEKRYIIKWERYQYSIRDGSLWQAEYRGLKKNSRWDIDIKGGEQEYYGRIQRAAHFYYYGDIGELRRPPRNFTGPQTKIAAKQECCDGVNVFYLPYLTDGVWPTISLKMYGAGSYNIFGTTIHEIAHSTHAANAIFIFPVAEKRMRETYAETIEWYLTTKYYVQRDPNFIYQDNLQYKTPADDPVYTSFMVDLVDDVNQRSNGSQFPLDNVENYSISQIENMVMNNATFTGFKDDLKRVYDNPTEGYLDQLRNNW